jgi:hypothetical protein
MLHWISIAGGLLIMMGHHRRSEALFYYFRLEEHIPETHLLRLIDKHISFEFVRQQLKDKCQRPCNAYIAIQWLRHNAESKTEYANSVRRQPPQVMVIGNQSCRNYRYSYVEQLTT